MKGKLFGGMKVKGPSTKSEQNKKQPSIPPQNSNDIKPQPSQQQIKNPPTDKIPTDPQHKSTHPYQPPSPSHSSKKSSLQSSQNLHQQSQPQPQPQPQNFSTSQQESLTKNNELPDKKLSFKTMSQKNYTPDNTDHNHLRQDRSLVLGNTQDEQEDLETKSKPKSTLNPPKSNPLLNQIKKITSKPTIPPKDKSELQPKDKSELQPRQTQKTLKNQNLSKPQKLSEKPKRQKSTIMDELYSSHSRILEQLIKKKQAKQQIILLTNHIFQLKQQLSVLTNQQNHYIATQDYDLADKIESKISSTNQKINQEEVQIKFVQQELYKMELEGLNFLKNHFEEEKRTIRRLKLVELDIQDEITHFKRQEQQKIQNSKSLNQNQKKKYQRIVTDIKNQSEQLQKYSKTFYEDLNSRKSPLQTQLTEEEQKKLELEIQIRELEEKLKKKKSLLKSTLSNIETTKQKILEVENTFEEEKEKLQERKKNINVLEGEKNHQQRKVQEMETLIKNMERVKTQQVGVLTKQKESFSNLSTRIQAFFESINVEEYLSRKKEAIEEFMRDSRALKMFEEQHRQKREKIKQLEFKKSNNLSEITKNEQRIKELKLKIPKLQTEQKQLSLAKNFKGAAMKKTQIKQCTDSIQQIKNIIQQAYALEAEIDSNIQEINADQQKYVEEENLLRKNLALSQFKLAVEKNKEISKELEWIAQLQQGNKLREIYQAKLKEQLTQIQEEITYIAQQYQLAEEYQPKVTKQQPKVTKQETKVQKKVETKIEAKVQNKLERKVQNKVQSKGVTRPVLHKKQSIQNETAQQDYQIQTGGQESIPNSETNQGANEEDSQQGQSREQSVYEPLQLQINDNYDEDNESNQDEVDANQDTSQNGQDESNEEQDRGYVPLQLD